MDEENHWLRLLHKTQAHFNTSSCREGVWVTKYRCLRVIVLWLSAQYHIVIVHYSRLPLTKLSIFEPLMWYVFVRGNQSFAWFCCTLCKIRLLHELQGTTVLCLLLSVRTFIVPQSWLHCQTYWSCSGMHCVLCVTHMHVRKCTHHFSDHSFLHSMVMHINISNNDSSFEISNLRDRGWLNTRWLKLGSHYFIFLVYHAPVRYQLLFAVS